MAQRPSSRGEVTHPDLTAMLDVVMQILLYFIMCARLINEQANAEVLLPVSQAARPMVQGEGEVVFVTVNAEGKILLTLGEPPMDLANARRELDKLASDYRKDGQVQAAVVIRAHRDAGYADIYRIMQTCKDKGFRRFKLRAMMIGQGE